MKAWRLLGTLMSRAGFSRSMGKTFGGDRDLWPTLGYRETLSVDVYMSFYERGDIAAQIVDLPATTSWQYNPEVRLVDNQVDGQGFIEDVKELDNRVKLWSKFSQVDRLTGIGRFGVLLIGLRGDGPTQSLAEEAQPIKGFEDVLFLKAFHEGAVDVETFVEDEFDLRFGLPETYRITFQRGDSEGTTTKIVHWSRVIHVAENLIDDDTYGTPRLQRVINKLDDLNKVVGSAAEIFWLAIAGVLHADLSPDVDTNAEELEAFETEIVESMQGLRRLIQTRGVTLNRIAAEGNVDPGPTYEAIKELLSATARIPNRVLFGPERGELASSQDQRTWNGTIKARQTDHCEPIIVRPFFERLSDLGLKLPDRWELYWPPLDEPTELELADIADKKSKAAVAMAPGGQVELLIRPWEARELLSLPPIPEEPPEGADEAFAEREIDDVPPDPNEELQE